MNSEYDIDAGFDPFWLSGKSLERHFKLEDALREFSRIFQHDADNDRALVIVGAAFIDVLLEHTMFAFLVNDEKEVADLLRYDQPLGTYGGRVRATYCFGLISKIVRTDLGIVGKVRNRFAHDLYASFDDTQIASWCKALQFHQTAYMQPPDDSPARDLFYVGVQILVKHMHGVVSIARGQQRQIRDG